MINDFLDWLYNSRNGGILIVFIVVFLLFLITLGAIFVRLAAPPEMLRFAFLMFTINFAIFITWYLRVYKNDDT